MAYDALEVVKTRNTFYRDGYRKVLLMLLAALVVIIGLVAIIFVLLTTRPTPKYFATTDTGRIIPLIPLSQPNLTEKAVLQWVSNTVLSIYSFNFVNYRSVFQSNRQYFTTAGWRGFMKAIDSSHTLDAIADRKLIVSAVVSGAPIVTAAGVISGRYTWKVQVPILVTYQGLNQNFSNSYLVTANVQRVSTLDNAMGIGIASFVVANR